MMTARNGRVAGRDNNLSVDGLFCFAPAERQLLERLNMAVRKRMASSSPRALRQLASFLFALERLPFPTSNFQQHLSIVSPAHSGATYVGVVLCSEEFSLLMYPPHVSPAHDGADEKETVFEVNVDGMRLGSTRTFGAWLEAFEAAPGPLSLETFDDADMTEGRPRSGWEALSAYWGGDDVSDE